MGNLVFYLDENLKHKELKEYDCAGYDLDEPYDCEHEQGEYMGKSRKFEKNCIDKALKKIWEDGK